MANPEHLAILTQGKYAWNDWRRGKSYFEKYDLSGADLTRVDLEHSNLRNVNLSGADLQNASLWNAIMVNAVLTETNLRGANLANADLTDAKLNGCDLTDADLVGTKLIDADIGAANLSGARVGGTQFGNCDLSAAKGLLDLNHWGPSTLGLDTIYKSRGKIPESFLRSCGVPESFITQMRSLVNAEDGLRFYSCFISHSTKDAEFATRLHGKMRDAHLRVWYSPEDMAGGKKLHEEIETQIRVYDKLLVILSEHSLESEWVKTELRKAFKAERESGQAGRPKQRKLFPVRLTDMERIKAWSCFDADSGLDLGVEMREYFIPDFSHWKEHDQFEASFARLLKDLQAETRPA